MLPFILTMSAAILFVFTGNLAGKSLPVLKRFALPGSVIGGTVALVIGPQVIDPERWPVLWNISTVYEQLSKFPGLFINVVFACLMLGRQIDSFKKIWSRAKPNIVMGHIYAWGQHVVGLIITVTILIPVLGLSELSGPLIAIGFQGGHGTAAGLGPNFKELGFAGGESLALAVATFGVLVGAVGGPFIANYLRKRYEKQITKDFLPRADRNNDSTRQANQKSFQPNPLTGRLTVHLAIIVIVIGLGWSLLQAFQTLERYISPTDRQTYFTDFIPLFSVVLIVGMGIQLILQKTGWTALFDRDLFQKISAFGLDMVIVSALATLSLKLITEHWVALLLICLAGIGWNFVILFLLGPKIYPKPWYPYGMGDFGGGTATTASGILLVHVSDPDKQSGALAAYTDKQPFYEPLMGGGLVTAMALPTVAFLGPVAALAITGTVLSIWLLLAWQMVSRNQDK